MSAHYASGPADDNDYEHPGDDRDDRNDRELSHAPEAQPQIHEHAISVNGRVCLRIRGMVSLDLVGDATIRVISEQSRVSNVEIQFLMGLRTSPLREVAYTNGRDAPIRTLQRPPCQMIARTNAESQQILCTTAPIQVGIIGSGSMNMIGQAHVDLFGPSHMVVYSVRIRFEIPPSHE